MNSLHSTSPSNPPLERLRQDPIARSAFFAQLDRLAKTGHITYESALYLQSLAMPRCACGGPQQAVDADGVARCPDCQSLAATGAALPAEEPFYHLPFAGPADLEPLLCGGRL